MRLIYLPMIAFMVGTVPAFAGTDSGDVPNPFTEPSAGQTTTSGAVEGTGAAVEPPNIGQDGEVSRQQGDRSRNANSSSSFYQQQKKDSDGR